MKKFLTAFLAATAIAAPAHAYTVVFQDNFDGEGAALNYTTFANFNAPAASGTVDVVASGTYGITCAGGSGKCVDLDGSTSNAGSIASKNLFSFGAGDVLTLSFDLSGNQRNTSLDNWAAGFFDVSGLLQASSVTRNAGCGATTQNLVTPAAQVIGINSSLCALPGNTPFTSRLVSFTALNAGSARIFFTDTNPTGDNIGPMLDNVRLEISSGAVPEPATWAMMIAGFGLVGASMRRKATKVSYA